MYESLLKDLQVQSGLVKSLVETDAEGEAETVVVVAGWVAVFVLSETRRRGQQRAQISQGENGQDTLLGFQCKITHVFVVVMLVTGLEVVVAVEVVVEAWVVVVVEVTAFDVVEEACENSAVSSATRKMQRESYSQLPSACRAPLRQDLILHNTVARPQRKFS
jgi:hypothetical protein